MPEAIIAEDLCKSLRLSIPGPIVHDRFPNCTFIDVETSDYYGSGKGLHSTLGAVFLPCSRTLHVTRSEAVRLPGARGEG